MQLINKEIQGKASGFTLIEVLITIIVLAIGLLGMAALQSTGLKNNNSAYMRSQATVLAYDMADRMRANSKGTYAAVAVPSAAIANCKTTVGCTVNDMAKNDIYEWDQLMQSILPSSSGVITVSANNVATIEVKWHDNPDGVTKSFKMSFLQ